MAPNNKPNNAPNNNAPNNNPIRDYKDLLDLEEKILKRIGELRRELQNPAESITEDLNRSKQLEKLFTDLQKVRNTLSSFSLNT